MKRWEGIKVDTRSSSFKRDGLMSSQIQWLISRRWQRVEVERSRGAVCAQCELLRSNSDFDDEEISRILSVGMVSTIIDRQSPNNEPNWMWTHCLSWSNRPRRRSCLSSVEWEHLHHRVCIFTSVCGSGTMTYSLLEPIGKCCWNSSPN